jgi:hypothetical protein
VVTVFLCGEAISLKTIFTIIIPKLCQNILVISTAERPESSEQR